MFTTKLLLIFGLSGVGKSTACAEYVCSHRNVVHFSASSLLKLHRETASMRSLDDVMKDQNLLVDLVRTHRAASAAHLMLLDAHSILIIDEKEFVVPTDVIAALEPNGLIFFEATAEVISQRRISRGDKETKTSIEVNRLQSAALLATREYSQVLGCPLSIINADYRIDLAGAISELL